MLTLPPLLLPELEIQKSRYKKEKSNLLGLADVEHNIDKHSGVDKQEKKDWKVEPEELVHTTVEVTAPRNKD